MKRERLSAVSEGRSLDPESAAFAAWYATHSSVRRLRAVRNSYQLRILVTLEPTHDDCDAYPAWLATAIHGRASSNCLRVTLFDWNGSMSQYSMER